MSPLYIRSFLRAILGLLLAIWKLTGCARADTLTSVSTCAARRPV